MPHIEAIDPITDEKALYEELFAPLPVPMPGLDAEPGSQWTPPAGVFAAREDGVLLAWVVYFARDPGSPHAVLQWITVERERQRITAGHNTEHSGTPDEIDTLTALASAAAAAARAAGYTHLHWHPAEPDLAEGIALGLHAQTTRQNGYTSYSLTLHRN